MADQVHRVQDTLKRSPYTVFFSHIPPDPQLGATGDIWFQTETAATAQVAARDRGFTKRRAIYFHGGRLFIRTGGWVEQVVLSLELDDLSDICHPVRGWRLNVTNLAWMSASQVWNRKNLKPPQVQSSSTSRASTTRSRRRPAPYPAVQPPRSPSPHQTASTASPTISLNDWASSLIPEWKECSVYNSHNTNLGLQILLALRDYPKPLDPHGDPDSTLILERHSLVCTEHPILRDVLEQYAASQHECIPFACDASQAELHNTGLINVVCTWIAREHSLNSLCSIPEIPDTGLSSLKGLDLPPHLKEKKGVTIHWREEGKPSPWHYNLVPGSGITFPHVDTWTFASLKSHFTGKKLWLLWPGTVENYRILYANVFSGMDRLLSPLHAIQQMTDLEVLLVDSYTEEEGPHCPIHSPSWVMPAGTIHCVMTFDRAATHGGLSIYHVEWLESAKAASENILTLLRTAIIGPDVSADQYLHEISRSMDVWRELSADQTKKTKVAGLKDWARKLKAEVDGLIQQRQPTMLPHSVVQSFLSTRN